MLHKHYDDFKHEQSGHVTQQNPKAHPTGAFAGLPLTVLQSDWWLPGSTSRSDLAKYQGKGQWKEILTCTENTCLLWAQRVTQDSDLEIFLWAMAICLGNHISSEILWATVRYYIICWKHVPLIPHHSPNQRSTGRCRIFAERCQRMPPPKPRTSVLW